MTGNKDEKGDDSDGRAVQCIGTNWNSWMQNPEPKLHLSSRNKIISEHKSISNARHAFILVVSVTVLPLQDLGVTLVPFLRLV